VARVQPNIASFVNREWSTLAHCGGIAAARLPGILSAAAVRWALLSGLLLLWTPARHRGACAVLFLFVLVDLGSVGKSFLLTEPNHLLFDAPPAARAIRAVARPPAYGFLPLQEYIASPPPADPYNAPYREAFDTARATLRSDLGAAFGVFYAFNNDYDLSDLYRVDLARREISREEGRAPWLAQYLAAFSARAAIVSGGLQPNGFSRPVRVLRPDWIVVNPKALPSIRFATDVREVAGPAEAYQLIHSGAVDLAAATVVETGRRQALHLPAGRIRVLRLTADSLTLEVEVPGDARVVLARAYSPFRRIRMDGVAAKQAPADLCLTTLAIPPGRHTVELTEELPGAAAGLSLTLAGLALMVYLLASRRVRAPF
jgi:hypothetical protein